MVHTEILTIIIISSMFWLFIQSMLLVSGFDKLNSLLVGWLGNFVLIFYILTNQLGYKFDYSIMALNVSMALGHGLFYVISMNKKSITSKYLVSLFALSGMIYAVVFMFL